MKISAPSWKLNTTEGRFPMAAKVKIEAIVAQARKVDNERSVLKRLRQQYLSEYSVQKGDVVTVNWAPHLGKSMRVTAIQLRESRAGKNAFEVVMRGPVLLASGKEGARSGERVVPAVK
jgi:hypothetical protein